MKKPEVIIKGKISSGADSQYTWSDDSVTWADAGVQWSGGAIGGKGVQGSLNISIDKPKILIRKQRKASVDVDW